MCRFPGFTPAKAYYEFKGWALSSDGPVLTSPVNVTESITLYAIWQLVAPQIIDEPGEAIVQGDEALFTSDADFEWFIEVKVDGETLTQDVDYTAVSGSTEVTLLGVFTETLEIGQHTLGIVSENGTASTTFTVVGQEQDQDAAPSSSDAAIPATGDNSHVTLWIALLLASMATLAVAAAFASRRRKLG